MRDEQEWSRVLRELKVGPEFIALYAPAFADVFARKSFSKGDADLADFLPTILHESRMLEAKRENGYYRADRIRELGLASPAGSRWRSLVPRAEEIEKNDYKFFEACYGGRMGNGPEGSGDGFNFAGGGLLGITGRDNYQWLADRAGQDIGMMHELVVMPIYGTEFCFDWWEGHIPDSILGDERKIRRVVNGGYFGLAEVEYLAQQVRKAL